MGELESAESRRRDLEGQPSLSPELTSASQLLDNVQLKGACTPPCGCAELAAVPASLKPPWGVSREDGLPKEGSTSSVAAWQETVAEELLEKLNELLAAASKSTNLQAGQAEPRSPSSEAVKAAEVLRAAAASCASAARRGERRSGGGAAAAEVVPVFEPKGLSARPAAEECVRLGQAPATPQWSEAAAEAPRPGERAISFAPERGACLADSVAATEAASSPAASARAVQAPPGPGAAEEALAALRLKERELDELRDVVEELRGRNECLELRNTELHDHTSRAAAATKQATAAGAAARKLRELQAKKLHERINAQEAELVKLRCAMSKFECQAKQSERSLEVSAASGPAELDPAAAACYAAAAGGPCCLSAAGLAAVRELSSTTLPGPVSPCGGTGAAQAPEPARAPSPGPAALPAAVAGPGGGGLCGSFSAFAATASRSARSHSPSDRTLAPSRTLSPTAMRGMVLCNPAPGSCAAVIPDHSCVPSMQNTIIPEHQALQSSTASGSVLSEASLSRSGRGQPTPPPRATLSGNWRHLVGSGGMSPRAGGQQTAPYVMRQVSDGFCTVAPMLGQQLSSARPATPSGPVARMAAGHCSPLPPAFAPLPGPMQMVQAHPSQMQLPPGMLPPAWPQQGRLLPAQSTLAQPQPVQAQPAVDREQSAPLQPPQQQPCNVQPLQQGGVGAASPAPGAAAAAVVKL